MTGKQIVFHTLAAFHANTRVFIYQNITFQSRSYKYIDYYCPSVISVFMYGHYIKQMYY